MISCLKYLQCIRVPSKSIHYLYKPICIMILTFRNPELLLGHCVLYCPLETGQQLDFSKSREGSPELLLHILKMYSKLNFLTALHFLVSHIDFCESDISMLCFLNHFFGLSLGAIFVLRDSKDFLNHSNNLISCFRNSRTD